MRITKVLRVVLTPDQYKKYQDLQRAHPSGPRSGTVWSYDADGLVPHQVKLGLSDANATEYLAVTGHSGSGKSTFMNLVGALDTPTSGSLKIEDRELSGLSSDALAQYRNEKIGFVFQTFNLLARTAALDNVALPLRYSHRHGEADGRQKARECLARVGLAARERH